MDVLDVEDDGKDTKFETQLHIKKYLDNLDSQALNSPDAEDNNVDSFIQDFRANNPNFEKLVEQVNQNPISKIQKTL